MFEDVTPTVNANAKVLDSYGPGRFTVLGELIEGSVILTSDSVINWQVNGFDDLNTNCLDELFALNEEIEVLLIGCGDKMQLIPADLRAHIKSKNIALDFMATGAAARTYNIMLSEGRKVAAALIATSTTE